VARSTLACTRVPTSLLFCCLSRPSFLPPTHQDIDDFHLYCDENAKGQASTPQPVGPSSHSCERAASAAPASTSIHETSAVLNCAEGYGWRHTAATDLRRMIRCVSWAQLMSGRAMSQLASSPRFCRGCRQQSPKGVSIQTLSSSPPTQHHPSHTLINNSIQLQRERELLVPADYLGCPEAAGHQGERFVTPQMRSIVCSWLSEVAAEFRMQQETLFLAVALLDKFQACSPAVGGWVWCGWLCLGALAVTPRFKNATAPA